MNEVKIYNEIDSLLVALAEEICQVAERAIKERGAFNFVLSGGNSPKKLYQLLASKSFAHRIDWKKTCFFFGDERFVPKDDLQRNSQMAKETLFDPLKIAECQIFLVDTSGSPQEAAEKYFQSINAHFGKHAIRFDFILLGLGDNAHTASLFPNTSVLVETEATIKKVFVEEVDMYRITMTAPLINQARTIAFLVFGSDKAEAVYHVLKDSTGKIDQYPAKLIKQENQKIMWFLDSSAASKLSNI